MVSATQRLYHSGNIQLITDCFLNKVYFLGACNQWHIGCDNTCARKTWSEDAHATQHLQHQKAFEGLRSGQCGIPYPSKHLYGINLIVRTTRTIRRVLDVKALLNAQRNGYSLIKTSRWNMQSLHIKTASRVVDNNQDVSHSQVPKPVLRTTPHANSVFKSSNVGGSTCDSQPSK